MPVDWIVGVGPSRQKVPIGAKFFSSDWEERGQIALEKIECARQRLLGSEDIEIAQAIKKLLYDEQYTIAGAIKKLEELEKEKADQTDIFPIAETPAAPTKSAPEPAKFNLRIEEDSQNGGHESLDGDVPTERIREFIGLLDSSNAILRKHHLA